MPLALLQVLNWCWKDVRRFVAPLPKEYKRVLPYVSTELSLRSAVTKDVCISVLTFISLELQDKWVVLVRKSKRRGSLRACVHGCETSYAFSDEGSTLTNLPIEPLSLNCTTPVTLANKVSSLPRPTFRPGLMGVPRWRTMIDPPGTSCPPKTFTPSRCAFESRPLRELPKPFLCAINEYRVESREFSCRSA